MKAQLFLCLFAAMLFSGSALGKYSGGSGTPADPYRIADYNDLYTLADDANDYNKNFILTNDIDLDPNLPGRRTLTKALIAPDTNPSSSGFQGTKFAGSFDGGGRKIRNLRIDTDLAGNDYLGLFGYIDGPAAEVNNLGLEDAVIAGETGLDYLGGLCGRNYVGTISNCYATGSVTGGTSSYFLGGLCGGNGGTISNCHATGSVTGGPYSFDLGGLCGCIDSGTLSDCYATGAVTGGTDSWYLGGLCGYNGNYGTISNCYATGSVTVGTDSYYLGGLCGDNGNGTISNCYATGSVTGGTSSYFLGGLCGSHYHGTISDCYAAGPVTGDQRKGGFCGYNSSGAYFTACFWDTEASGMTDGVGDVNPDPAGVMGRTTSQMMTRSTFTSAGWNFVGDANLAPDVWDICEGTNYPRLVWSIPPADLVCPDGVTFPDFSFLAERWLRNDCAINDDCDGADFDLSGAVDIADLDVLCNYWLEGI